MKYLKINDNKGYFQTGSENWTEIDKISKDDLLTLVDKAVEDEFEMDEFIADNIGNKAHSIIYKHLHQKFTELVGNKSRFKDESEQMYKASIDKYSEVLRPQSQTETTQE